MEWEEMFVVTGGGGGGVSDRSGNGAVEVPLDSFTADSDIFGDVTAFVGDNCNRVKSSVTITGESGAA